MTKSKADTSTPLPSLAPRRPPVTVTFEVPGAPRRPRLARYLTPVQRTSYYVLFTVAAVWVFGGMLFFFVRFSTVVYLDNQHAIRSALERFIR